MAKYVCPLCGNDGSKGVFSKNMVIEAFWNGEFDEKGAFEVDECQSPDYENCDAHGADEVVAVIEGESRSMHRLQYHCCACGEDFQEPKKAD